MKNKLFLLIGVILVLSLGLTSCDDKSSSKGPNLTAFALLTKTDAENHNWNQTTTFSKTMDLYTVVDFELDNFNPLEKGHFIFWAGNTVIWEDEVVFSTTHTGPRLWWGYWVLKTFNPGNYSMEVYFIDTADKKSNTRKQNFTVTN